MNGVHKLRWIGMGTMHAWESFGDGVAPDIQAVAKGLGGGWAQPVLHSSNVFLTLRWIRYASIGAVLMSSRIADGIRGHSGLWKHGHTYQVLFYLLSIRCDSSSL